MKRLRISAWCLTGLIAAAGVASTATAQSGPQADVFHLPDYDLSQTSHVVEGLCIEGMGWPDALTENPDVFEIGSNAAVNMARRTVRRNGSNVLYAVSPGCLSLLQGDLGEENVILIDPASLLP